MKITRRGVLAAISGSAITAAADRARAVTSNLTYSITGTAQTITDVNPKSAGFVGGAGSAGRAICTFAATMSPPTPAFSGTWSLGGTDQAKFVLNSTTGALSVGASDVPNGSYSVIAFATQGGSVFSQPVSLTASAPTSGLTAEITFPGGSPVSGTLVYTMSGATDMGNYVAPTAGFTQQCLRARNASLPNFFVDFRPDVSGGRIEVVFWNGEVFGTVPSGYTRDLTASYNVVIKNNGVQIGTASVPYHYWGNRWRWTSGPGPGTNFRPLIRTAAQLFSQGWLPPMSTTQARLAGNNLSTGKPWSGLPYSDVASGGSIIVPGAPKVLDSSDVGTIGPSTPYQTGPNGPVYTPFMQAVPVDAWIFGCFPGQDAGGSKQEEGLISSWQADWIFKGTASSLNAFMQQGELCACQFNGFYLPDQVTGACPYYKQDLAHFHSSTTGNTQVFAGYYSIQQSPSPHTIGGGLSASHFEGGWFYLQYVLTEDPFFLEALQFYTAQPVDYDITRRDGVVGNLAADPTGQTGMNGAFTVGPHPGETRNIGWSVKNIAQAWKCSPASPPSWIRPQSDFAAYSSDFSVVLQKMFRSNADQVYSYYNYYGIGDYYQTFEQAYNIIAFAFSHFLGLPVPQVAGQIVPPAWKDHATTSFGMLDKMFTGTVGQQFSTAGWNRQVPLIHDLWAAMLSDGSSGNFTAGGTCPTVTHTTDYIGSFGGINCVGPNMGACYTLYGPSLQDGATFPTAAFPGNQEYVGLNNVCWALAGAAMCSQIGIANANTVYDYLNIFADYNFPNMADSQGGIAFVEKAAFVKA